MPAAFPQGNRACPGNRSAYRDILTAVMRVVCDLISQEVMKSSGVVEQIWGKIQKRGDEALVVRKRSDGLDVYRSSIS